MTNVCFGWPQAEEAKQARLKQKLDLQEIKDAKEKDLQEIKNAKEKDLKEEKAKRRQAHQKSKVS